MSILHGTSRTAAFASRQALKRTTAAKVGHAAHGAALVHPAAGACAFSTTCRREKKGGGIASVLGSMSRSGSGASRTTAHTTPGSNTTDTASANKAKGKKPTTLRNEHIPFTEVHVVNPLTSKLDPPTSLFALLDSIKRNHEYVELVTTTPVPIVKVVNAKEEYKKRKEAKDKAKKGDKESKGKGIVNKEVQMRWGAGEADVAHKLRKARDELSKGSRYRVDFVITGRKGSALPPRQEIDKKIGEWVKTIVGEGEVVGKEWKGREIRGGTTVVFLQGVEGRVEVEEKEKERKERKEKERDDEDDDFA
ncbi:hypothetical protein AX16_000927 [Volvariella volvacea WC 439]|nr:hypothetical protein AX16_000927 [Volvariella volvacea WC 439]